MFRFTIRELLLFTAIAGVAAAWWIDRNRLADTVKERDLWSFRANAAADLLRENRGRVDWNDDSITVTQTDSGGRRRMIMLKRESYAIPAATKTGSGGPSAPVRVFPQGGG